MHGGEKRFHPDEKLKSFFLHKTTETDPAFRKALMQMYHRIAEVVFAYNPSLWYFLVIIMFTVALQKKFYPSVPQYLSLRWLDAFISYNP